MTWKLIPPYLQKQEKHTQPLDSPKQAIKHNNIEYSSNHVDTPTFKEEETYNNNFTKDNCHIDDILEPDVDHEQDTPAVLQPTPKNCKICY